jgi:hypothetical protein
MSVQRRCFKRFQRLGDLPTDTDEAWTTACHTSLAAAAITIPVKTPKYRPWLNASSLKITPKKKAAMLKGDPTE